MHINKYFVHFLCGLFVMFSFLACNAQVSIQPAAHVLMPAYNADKFILSTIQTVLNQDYKNIKLLIFNDGSTPHSQGTCRL